MPESPLHKLREPITPATVRAAEVAYAELDVTTNFSFLRGASHPDEYVAAAAALGYRAIAITDRNTLAGVVRAHVAAKQAELKLLIGCRLTLSDAPELLVWCQNRQGYANLCQLLTLGKSRVGKGEFQLSTTEFLQHCKGLFAAICWPMTENSATSSVPLPPREGAEGGASGELRETAENAPATALHHAIEQLSADQTPSHSGHSSQSPPTLPSPARGEAEILQVFETPLTPRTTQASHLQTAAHVNMFPRLALLVTNEQTDHDAPKVLDTSIHSQGPLFNPSPEGEETIQRLHEVLGDKLSLAVSQTYGVDNESHLKQMQQLSRRLRIPLVATNNVHYFDPSRRPLQDVLVCIREKCTIDQGGFKLFANAERYLKEPAQMHRLFIDCPEAIARAMEIANACTFRLDELKYEYPQELVPEGQTPIGHLSDLAWKGAADRYPDGIPDKVRNLIVHELKLIDQLKFPAYFLTVYDVVKFARSRGILCQGRGSAANSAVCYCIGITSVDPSRIDLLFERFVSSARNEPPDIDVDFEHERREEVIQYIYTKYGRARAGMCAEIISYRGRSAIRDVGKALGLSLDMVDAMARKLGWWDRGVLSAEQLREAGLDPDDANVRRIVTLATQILGFPRHLGQHVGGMVMTQTPLCQMVPIENAAMPDRTVIEWDKDDIDAVGILKVDCLALGMLTVISKAFRLIHEHAAGMTNDEFRMTNQIRSSNDRMNGKALPPHSSFGHSSLIRHSEWEIRHSAAAKLQLHTVPQDDPLVYDMICDADTIGVFQIESRAQMSMLPRLRPRCFYDLVIEVAIVRPGPIQGNMVHPYLRRRCGEEQVVYPSEALREVLHKTLGVPLFQEQAMKVAMVGAGFSAEEADQLRRAMAAWRRSDKLQQMQERIITGMLRNGYTPQFAAQCFEQIKGFGEYGFPESHSASFALLVYVSAYLKRHHPAAFAAALINSQPMGFYAPAQIIRDAREHGVEVRPVDVNESEWDCTLESFAKDNLQFANEESGNGAKESFVVDPNCKSQIENCKSHKTTWGHPGPAIRLGFRIIKGIKQSEMEKIVVARQRVGRFESVDHLHKASGITKKTIQKLAEADAFGSIAMNRREALWDGLELTDAEMPLFSSDEVTKRRSDEVAMQERHIQARTTCPPPLAGGGRGRGSTGEVHSISQDASEHLNCDSTTETPTASMQNGNSSHSPPTLPSPARGEGLETTAPLRPNLTLSPADTGENVEHQSPIANPQSAISLPPMPLGQEVMTDYATIGMSLKAHPLQLVRGVLREQKIITAAELMQTIAGRWVRVAGLVLIRQRPGTAAGIVFITLEDETGICNLILRENLFERYRAAACQAALLQADGYVERQGQVVHVMAKRLFDRSDLIRGYEFTSRDFH